MNNVGSAGKKRANESEDDRKAKQAKASEFGDIEPHTFIRSLDKVRPGEILEACPALKARYHSDLAFVLENGHISQPTVAAMYDAWFKVCLSYTASPVFLLTIIRSGSQPYSNNTGPHTSATAPSTKSRARSRRLCERC